MILHISRRTAVAVGAAAVLTLGGAGGFVVTAASADSGDTVTGGTIDITQPVPDLYQVGIHGFFSLPAAPASAFYDRATKGVDYSLPVVGGDGSVESNQGEVDTSGALTVINASAKSTDGTLFQNLSYRFDYNDLIAFTDTLHGPISVATLAGTQSRKVDPATHTETVDASSLLLSTTGAYFLNYRLRTKYFKAGTDLGRFHMVITTQS